VEYAEVELYGDVVLRLLATPGAPARAADAPSAPLSLLPGYLPLPAARGQHVAASGASAPLGGTIPPLARLDHVVGNVPQLSEVWPYIARMTGFHPFAEFVAEDVGTVDSGERGSTLLPPPSPLPPLSLSLFPLPRAGWPW
jgi:4-hydroxyphenylpyruvate dioxygenase